MKLGIPARRTDLGPFRRITVRNDAFLYFKGRHDILPYVEIEMEDSLMFGLGGFWI